MAVTSGATYACTDYADYLHWVESIAIPNKTPSRVYAQGDYIYIVDNDLNPSLLYVFDSSVTGNSVLVGTMSIPGFGEAVYGAGSNIAVSYQDGNGFAILLIVDVSDPTAPNTVGSTAAVSGSYSDIWSDGTYVFVTNYNGQTFDVYDITDPTMPTLVASVNVGGGPRRFIVEGGVAYVAAFGGGLTLIDVSSPEAAYAMSNYPVFDTWWVTDVAKSGNVIYAAMRHSVQNLQIWTFDVSDPYHTPIKTGEIDTAFLGGNYYMNLVIASNVCYYSVSTGALWYFPLENPAASLNFGKSNGGGLMDLAVFGPNLYVLRADHVFKSTVDDSRYDYGYVNILSVNSPDPLKPISSIATPGDAHSVVMSAAKTAVAFVADGDAGMQVVDVSNPLNPVIVQTVDTPGIAEAIALDGDIAYVADGPAGVHAIDVTNPLTTTPVILDTQDTPGNAVELVIQGSYAYIADSGSGLRIIDVSQPNDIFEVGFNDTLNAAQGIDVAGDYAYVADGPGGLKTLKVNDPSNPWIIGGVKSKSLNDAFAVDVSSGHAYVTDPAEGLVVLDLANPAFPNQISGIDMINTTGDVSVMGIFAYVGSGDNVDLVDIQDPANPLRVGVVDISTLSQGIFITPDYAYVAGGDSVSICPTQCGFDESVYAAFQANPQSEYYPITVDFLNLSEGYGMSFDWDFGDGTGSSMEKDPTYSYTAPGDYPVTLTVTNGVKADTTTVIVSALSEKPTITGVLDIPDDQGGYVYVNFYFSGYDDTQPNKSELYSVQRLDGETWVNVLAIGCYGAHYYTAQVNTLGNGASSATDYRVIAHMDEGIWISDPVIGFSEDNIPPQIPGNVVWLDETHLTWDPVPDSDLDHYQLYGSDDGLVEGSVPLAATTETSIVFTQTDFPWLFVRAVDVNGLESPPSNAVAVSSVPPAVTKVVLAYPYPNPFNPQTGIEYGIPESGHVQLSVYDLAGRKVRILVNENQASGWHKTYWDGKDDAGRRVSSGPYFFQLKALHTQFTRRMLLVK